MHSDSAADLPSQPSAQPVEAVHRSPEQELASPMLEPRMTEHSNSVEPCNSNHHHTLERRSRTSKFHKPTQPTVRTF